MRASTLRRRQRLYRQAHVLIGRHYRRPLTLTVLARALASSPRELQRAFVEVGRSSFAAELTDARLAAAAELLAGQALPVATVARLVGLHNASQFARSFRRRYGLAPAEFRATARVARSQPRITVPPTAATTRGS